MDEPREHDVDNPVEPTERWGDDIETLSPRHDRTTVMPRPEPAKAAVAPQPVPAEAQATDEKIYDQSALGRRQLVVCRVLAGASVLITIVTVFAAPQFWGQWLVSATVFVCSILAMASIKNEMSQSKTVTDVTRLKYPGHSPSMRIGPRAYARLRHHMGAGRLTTASRTRPVVLIISLLAIAALWLLLELILGQLVRTALASHHIYSMRCVLAFVTIALFLYQFKKWQGDYLVSSGDDVIMLHEYDMYVFWMNSHPDRTMIGKIQNIKHSGVGIWGKILQYEDVVLQDSDGEKQRCKYVPSSYATIFVNAVNGRIKDMQLPNRDLLEENNRLLRENNRLQEAILEEFRGLRADMWVTEGQ